jgi:hypothetical protein
VSRRDRVVYTDPGGRGWASVEVMARLLASILDADFVRLETRPRSDRARRATGILPRRRATGTCYVIAPQPAHLGSVLGPAHFLKGYERVVGWVVDSWLTDRVPRMAGQGHFDHLYVTDAELVDLWREATGVPTTWLPFGTDALGQPDPHDVRPTDLLRVGRQPAFWDDHATIEALASHRGLTFASGPPIVADPITNQRALTGAMRESKYTLSFTNLVSPAEYTHPTHDYVTARWTDALAAGATVAGARPTSIAGQQVLWDEACFELSPTDPARALDELASAVAAWSPEHARRVRHRALTSLDWRLRFRELVASDGHVPARLDDELEALATKAAHVGEGLGD